MLNQNIQDSKQPLDYFKQNLNLRFDKKIKIVKIGKSDQTLGYSVVYVKDICGKKQYKCFIGKQCQQNNNLELGQYYFKGAYFEQNEDHGLQIVMKQYSQIIKCSEHQKQMKDYFQVVQLIKPKKITEKQSEVKKRICRQKTGQSSIPYFFK